MSLHKIEQKYEIFDSNFMFKVFYLTATLQNYRIFVNIDIKLRPTTDTLRRNSLCVEYAALSQTSGKFNSFSSTI